MTDTRRTAYRWAALNRSENRLDGKREYLASENCMPVLFRTRNEAREWISQKYGYIRRRPDLRAEPHGWKPTIPVKVKVVFEVQR